MNLDFGAELGGGDADVRRQSSVKRLDSHCGSGAASFFASREHRPAVGSRRRSLYLEKPFLGFSLVLVSAQMLFCAETSTNNSASSLGPTAPPDSPAAYMRVTKSGESTVALEIALRRFVPLERRSPLIWLAGASHLGESNYYAGLQLFLDAQPLVLFEGIGAGTKRSRPAAAEDNGGIQTTMAKSLGLAFQLDAIDYDRAHFRNSDLSVAQLTQLFAGGPAGPPGGGRGAGGKTSAAGEQFDELLGIMDGSSMIGALVHAGVKFISSSPKLRAMLKLVLIETMGEIKGDLAQMKGAPPEIQRLLAIIIQDRNKVVLDDLRREIHSPAPPASIAVFYGAGHMADFEKRLTQDLGYRPAGEVWLRAMALDTRQAGLSEADIASMRALIRWQLQMLEGETK